MTKSKRRKIIELLMDDCSSSDMEILMKIAKILSNSQDYSDSGSSYSSCSCGSSSGASYRCG